jgi:hypothetical protein
MSTVSVTVYLAAAVFETDQLDQNLDHFITFSIINAEPELPYSSVVNTIRCWAVTSGECEDSTFVRWTSKFSSDADLGAFTWFSIRASGRFDVKVGFS